MDISDLPQDIIGKIFNYLYEEDITKLLSNLRDEYVYNIIEHLNSTLLFDLCFSNKRLNRLCNKKFSDDKLNKYNIYNMFKNAYIPKTCYYQGFINAINYDMEGYDMSYIIDQYLREEIDLTQTEDGDNVFEYLLGFDMDHPKYKNIHLAKRLLEYPHIELNYYTLDRAVEFGDPDIVKRILDRFVNINLTQDDYALFKSASYKDDKTILNYLLNSVQYQKLNDRHKRNIERIINGQ